MQKLLTQEIEIVDLSNNGELKTEQIKIVKPDSINYIMKHIPISSRPMLYRQGDIVLTRLAKEEIPNNKEWVIIKGDARITLLNTHHILSHALAYKSISNDQMLLAIDQPTTLTHNNRQHASLEIPAGFYSVRHTGLPARRMFD